MLETLYNQSWLVSIVQTTRWVSTQHSCPAHALNKCTKSFLRSWCDPKVRVLSYRGIISYFIDILIINLYNLLWFSILSNLLIIYLIIAYQRKTNKLYSLVFSCPIQRDSLGVLYTQL